jgi:hypothetical protein
MRMRKLGVAAVILALAGSNHAVARDSSHGHSRGHVRHSGVKPANARATPSPAVTPAASDQRHPEDAALDRKIKSICRGC